MRGKTPSLWMVLAMGLGLSCRGDGRAVPDAGVPGAERAGEPGPGAPADRATSVAALSAEEIAGELQFSPTTATWLGDHHFDDRLDDVRAEAVAREIARLRNLRERARRLLSADGGTAPPGTALDEQLLLSRLDSQLIELDELRPHERNPVFYMNILIYGIDGLLQPDFIRSEGRVRALAHRLGQVPELCREAQRNLKNPSELATRRAIDLGQQARSFLTLLPRLSRAVADQKLREEFSRNTEEARRALDDMLAWMNRDLLPRSRGEWALGRDLLTRRLQALELLDVPLETVQGAAERELKEVWVRLEDAARAVAGATPHPVADTLHLLEDDHPRPDEVLHSAEATLGAACDAVAGQGLMTLPAARPRVMEMPPYRWGYAQFAAPGPLETRSRDAVLYIDPVDPAWRDKKRIQDHLRMLNRTQLLLTALHEVAPGHFAQEEAWHQVLAGAGPAPSLIRQRTRSWAMIEGWAHYAAELLAGRWSEPEASNRLLVLMLRQQVVALGRLIVALRLHAPGLGGAGGASAAARLEDGVRFFEDECAMDEYAARREAERLTYDPLSLLPALGRLQMRKLARDAQAQAGEKFSLKAFHDSVVQGGELPVAALRQVLLTAPGASIE